MGQDLRCSLAMAFLINAVPMLREGGQMVSVLPLGSLTSEKDRAAWGVLREIAHVDVVSRHDKKTFHGCYPRTALVRVILRARSVANEGEKHIVEPPHRPCCEPKRLAGETMFYRRLTRGWVQMHTVASRDGKLVPLVHSKDLTADYVRTGDRMTRSVRELRGPAVLMPRVGQPDRDNVCILKGNSVIALSDCVIALETKSLHDARQIHSLVRQNWPVLERTYGGTCARYVTLKDLESALGSLGVHCQRIEGKGRATRAA
jgi:hypothetical protein